jgi:PAS domain S-box-containing protein
MSPYFSSNSKRRRVAFLTLVAGIGVCLSLAGYWALRSDDARRLGTRLEADAEQRARAIESRFRVDLTAIWGLSSFVRRGQPGSRDEFGEVAGRVQNGNHNIHAAYWIPQIEADERELYELAARSEGLTTYETLELGVDGRLHPAFPSNTEDLLPIYFAEPMDSQLAVLGLDLRSVDDLRELIDEAIATGRPSVSPAIAWADDPQGAKVFVQLRAVYTDLITGDGPELRDLRKQKLLGLLAVLIRCDDVLDEALSGFQPGIDVRMLDTSAAAGRDCMCIYRSESKSTEFPSPADAPPTAVRIQPPAVTLDVPGHQWSIECRPTADYLAEQAGLLPIISLSFGLLLTAVLTTYANTLLGRTERVQQLVDRRTAELDYERFLLETLLEYSPDYIYFKDRDSRFLRISRALAGYIGLEDPLAAVGKSDRDFFNAERAQQYLADEQQIMTAGQPIIDKEEKGVWPDGRDAYLSTTKVPLRNPQGEIVGTFGISRDITARKQAEEEAEYERYLLHSLMDSVPDSIYFKDADGRYLRINQAKAARSGFRDPAEAIGKSDADVFPEAHARQARADELQVLASGRPMIGKEEYLTWPDGKHSWVATTRLPLLDREGKIVGTLGISHDITGQKQAAEQMRIAKEAAEAASRAKGDFLANMSHEIRTPLNAIIGMTELVLDTDLASSQREYLKLVLESSESLLSVINDILDFSKIEAGKLTLESSEFELRESLGDALKSLAFRAHRTGLELAAEIHPDVPERLIGDAGRLRQVLVNLVGNAIKFTEAGEVIVEVNCPSRTAEAAELCISVRDTGIGIPPGKLAAIFEAFEQVDTSTTRRYGGTGLGLAICSRLVALMGGRIWVDSQVGQGSTFSFTVRFGLAQGEPLPKPSVVVQGTRVLVVDDNATNRRILDEILRSWDMQPLLVAGAREALQVLREAFRAGSPIPLVLTDANMPEIDGFTLAEQIKQDRELGSTVIMMLSSADRPGEIAHCEQMGLAAYLVKPIKQSELFDAVVKVLGVNAVDERPPSTPAEPPPLESLPPLRVLLVEDSLVNQKLAVALLQKHGHHVTVANDGLEGVATLESQAFDLVLMDVQMPEMDGYEATAKIRQRERLTGRHIPIVAMTAHAMKGDRESCLAAGMDSYVAKPIRAQQVFEAINAALRHQADSPKAADGQPQKGKS